METKSTFSKYILAALFCCVVFPTVAQLPALIPYRKGDLWGYCDSNKIVKIEPKFKYAGWFNELGQAEVEYKDINEYGDTVIVARMLNEDGSLVNYVYKKFDSGTYYYEVKDTLFIISKKSGTKALSRKNVLWYSYVRGNWPADILAYRAGKYVYVMVSENGVYRFKSKDLKKIKKVYDKNTAVYTKNKDSSVTLINSFKYDIYLICENNDSGLFIQYLNGKYESLPKNARFKESTGNYYIFNDSGDYIVFDKYSGKRLFSLATSGILKTWGKSLFVEQVSIDNKYFFTILNKRGKVIKRHLTDSELSYYAPYCSEFCLKTTYFKTNESCIIFQNESGELTEICNNKNIISIENKFIVFESKGAYDVYNSSAELIAKDLFYDSTFQHFYMDYNETDHLLFVLDDNIYLLDTTGNLIKIPQVLKRVIRINDNYWLGYYYDTNFVYYLLAFDNDGIIHKQYSDVVIDEEWMLSYQDLEYNGILKKNRFLGFLFPVAINDSEGLKYRFDKTILLAFTNDTIYSIEFNKKDHHAMINRALSYDDDGKLSATVFCYAAVTAGANTETLKYRDFYIDKYGTIYYDE